MSRAIPMSDSERWELYKGRLTPARARRWLQKHNKAWKISPYEILPGGKISKNEEN